MTKYNYSIRFEMGRACEGMHSKWCSIRCDPMVLMAVDLESNWLNQALEANHYV